MVHRVDQQPRTLVAHSHAPAGGGDRAGIGDAFEQVGLAGADGDVGAELDAASCCRSRRCDGWELIAQTRRQCRWLAVRRQRC
jgi:hypothetical protein